MVLIFFSSFNVDLILKLITLLNMVINSYSQPLYICLFRARSSRNEEQMVLTSATLFFHRCSPVAVGFRPHPTEADTNDEPDFFTINLY